MRKNIDAFSGALTGRKAERLKKIAVCVATFLFTLALAVVLPQDQAPDEYMRDDIPLWIFYNQKLPIGNEPELLNNVWGFSYGFLPYLPALLAQPLMYLFYAVVPTEESLLLAIRMVSVLSITASSLLCLKIGDFLFDKKSIRFLFMLMIVFVPQVTFVGAYHNNDSFALFSSLLIFYYLISGHKSHWAIKDCIGLAIGFSCCVLTYYNACTWILASIPFCITTCIKDSEIQKKGKFIASRALIIGVISFALAGWFFCRNAILHDGDFLGIVAQRACADAQRIAGYDVHTPSPPMSQGLSVVYMLFDMGWLRVTMQSMVAVFGYMNIYVENITYIFYFLLLGIGAVLGIYSFAKKGKRGYISLYVALAMVLVITVALSVYRSYTYDYQPQGRYIFPALPAISFMVASGYEELTHNLQILVRTRPLKKDHWIYVDIPLLISIFWIILYLYVYFTTIIPSFAS